MPLPLHAVTQALHEIAPLHLAEEWDNVGLLVEPSKPKPVARILLTIDLTDTVLDEAIRLKSDLVVAYHPPIFEPIKRLSASDMVTRLIENKISLHSPHTALDSAPGGVNDWLASGLGDGGVEPIRVAEEPNRGYSHKVVVFVPPTSLEKVRDAMARAGAGGIGAYTGCSFSTPGIGTFKGDATTHPAVGKAGRLESVDELRLEMVCDEASLPNVARAIRRAHPYEEVAWEVYALTPRPALGSGQGRRVTLKNAISLASLVGRVKHHLGLRRVRLAAGSRRAARVQSVSLCAGSGASVLRDETSDVLLTGEMRHHDILAANARGTSVILCDHTNTERGYLPILKMKLHEKLAQPVRIDVSKADREPLEIV